jgi:hypothetical protein
LSSLTTALSACRRSCQADQTRLDAARADLNVQLATDSAKLAEVGERLARLRPLAEAKERGRWWTATWWRATFSQVWKDQYREAENIRDRLEDNVERARSRLAELDTQKEELTSAFERNCRQLADEESARREKELDRQGDALARGQTLLEQEWKSIGAGLSMAGVAPQAIKTAAVQDAQSQLSNLLAHEERRQMLIHDWLRFLEQNKEPWTGKMAEHANLIAATPAALKHDPYFGDSPRDGHSLPPFFDLLILEQADRFGESELLALAHKARRCVLLGEGTHGGTAKGGPTGSTAALRTGMPHKARPFDLLWDKLHCNPREIPYAWIQEESRLCCRLRPVLPHQRRYIESECVADFPDIELRILSIPRTQPTLVEVSFPSTVSVDQAKQYIFRELQELAVYATNTSLRWQEESERLVLMLSDGSGENSVDFELEAGVRELLSSPSSNGHCSTHSVWHTRSIEFDKLRGWNRQRAEEWIHQYLGLRDLGRTAVLEELHHP